jgi:tetratricopeptide (TPR) repeat protein
MLRSVRFDRDLGDIVAVEDEIAEGVASALALTVDPAASSRKARSASLDAHLAYLQGKRLLARWRVDETKAAISKFDQAVALDPHDALALVGHAEALARYAWISGGDPTAEDARAQALIDRALAIDPSLGEAIVLRAFIEADEAGFRRGLALAPSYGHGYGQLAELLWKRGRVAEARDVLARPVIVDPLTPRHHHLEGLFRWRLEDADAAEASFIRALERDPEFSPSLTRLAELEASRGRYAQAAKRAEQALALDPRSVWIRGVAVKTYLALGDEAAARDLMEGSVRAQIDVAMYQGEVGRAGALVAALPDGERRDGPQDMLVHAVRDAGLHSGDLAGALRLLDGLGRDGDLATPRPRLLKPLAQANLLLRSGQRAHAEERLAAVADWLDRHAERTAGRGGYELERAVARAMRGDAGGALAALSVWAERHPVDAWYVLERDPMFAAIRATPRFAALRARFRAHVEVERAALEELRARGEVPRRPANEAARARFAGSG